MADRKQIPHSIYKVLVKEIAAEKERPTEIINTPDMFPTLQEMLETYDKSMIEVAQQIYLSLQVTLEFMDKGIKGLLTGDLSVYVI